MYAEVMAQLSWQSIVDVLCMAFIVYRILLIIRGTRAIQMLVGLVILMVITFIAKFANLRAIYWLLENFWTIWVLAIIVLFQPELRRALAQVGHRRLFEAFHRIEKSSLIEEIVRATLAMAGKRMGALIVFEGDTNLAGYVEIGTALEAQVSRELLLSLFNTKSPLHDGAVIVADGKLAFAGCFLPLASEQQASKELGTRHRAAIGLTEETDAVVIVVSEETGHISIAREGRLEQDLDAISLRRNLQKLFEKKTK